MPFFWAFYGLAFVCGMATLANLQRGHLACFLLGATAAFFASIWVALVVHKLFLS